MGFKSFYYVVFFVVTSVLPAAQVVGQDSGATALPADVAHQERLLLKAIPAGKNADSASGSVPVLHAEVIDQNADRVDVNGELLVFAKAGQAETKVTLEFIFDERVKPAQYEISTLFSIGGTADQQFDLFVGPDVDHLSHRGIFRQSSGKAWELVWRKSPITVTLFPGDHVMRITTQGMASQQKNLGAFLLTSVGSLPADIDARGGALRTAVDSWTAPAEVRSRIFILEGDSAKQAEPIFQALSALASEPALANASVQHLYGLDAREVAESVHATLPAFVLTDDRYKVLGILNQPGAAEDVSQFIREPQSRGKMPAISSELPHIESKPLQQGMVQEWATVGTWNGPAGLSLWGIDAEAAIRPSVGDPCLVSSFDSGKASAWTSRSLDGNGVITVDPSAPDVTWARGSAYAHVFIHVEQRTDVILQLTHSGIASVVRLDGQPVTLTDDARPTSASAHVAAEALAAAAKVEGVTDQGNRLAVGSQKMESPRRTSFTLAAGWHRLLVKLIVQTHRGQSIAFTATFTDSKGQWPFGLTTSTSDPEAPTEMHAAANRLTPLWYTDAPFNLSVAGAGVNARAVLAWKPRKGEVARQNPILPFDAKLLAVITDYDGREVTRQTVKGVFPGEVSYKFNSAFRPGYYGVQLSLWTGEGALIASYPPDGFSVIGGTTAQEERREKKKVAVTYYFMAKEYNTLFFPYMKRIGIYRNVGGNNARALDMYRESKDQGISLACDLWNYRDPDYLRTYISETAPYVDVYKAFNEIDIRPDQKGTPEAWVAKEKQDYQLVHQLDPTAIYLGGSLVRVGKDPWFEKCLQLGIDKYHDAWDIHAYPQQMPVLEGTISNSQNESELGLKAAFDKVGMTIAKPLWLGETGARSSHGSDARRWQAESVAKLVAWVNSRPDFQVIGLLIPWRYSRSGPSADAGDIEVGHMPGEAALYTVNALVDGLPYKRLDLGDKAIQAAWFGPTLMVWTTGGSQTVQVKLDGPGPWTLVDIVGRASPITPDEQNRAALNLSESPQYLLTQNDYERLIGLSMNNSR